MAGLDSSRDGSSCGKVGDADGKVGAQHEKCFQVCKNLQLPFILPQIPLPAGGLGTWFFGSGY